MEQLIKILRAVQPDVSAEEIADIFWLASLLEQPADSAQFLQPNPQPSTQGEGVLSNRTPETSMSELQPPPQAGLRLLGGGETSGRELFFRTPAGNASLDVLAVSKALRPLNRRIPSRTNIAINESATVKSYEHTGLLLPVLQPIAERWLDLSLVIDVAPTMAVWSSLLREFKLLIERQGAFRKIKVWHLVCDEQNRAWLRTTVRQNLGSGRPAEKLVDTGHPHLTLVVSDCLDDFWGKPAAGRLLSRWAASGPVAILQVLPQRMWERTWLNVHSGCFVLAPVHNPANAPGAPNANLRIFPTERRIGKTLPVPVISLHTGMLEPWAQIVRGLEQAQAPCYLFPLDEVAEESPVVSQGEALTEDEYSTEELYHFFLENASPEARKLAGYLAIPEMVNLSLMHLIQASLFSHPDPLHLAEVWLSGLMEQITSEEKDMEHALFRFPGAIRAGLRRQVRYDETLPVILEVARYIDQHARRLGETFPAVVGVAETSPSLPTGTFSQITAGMLRSLGGAYNQLAEQLEARVAERVITGEASVTLDPVSLQAEAEVIPEKTSIHMVPPPPANFIGRERELKELAQAARQSNLLLIYGPPGVGKTALALKLVELIGPNYPDGQIMVSDYELDRPGESAQLALLHILNNLFPDLTEDSGALNTPYQGRMTGRRLLILLDGVKGKMQFLDPLEPPQGCLMVVTSSEYFSEIGYKHDLQLGGLTETEAVELLLSINPAIQKDAKMLATACEYMPLMLTSTAHFLLQKPDLFNTYFKRTIDRKSLENVIVEISYQRMRADFQAMWRKLSVFMGDFTDNAGDWVAQAKVPAETIDSLLIKKIPTYAPHRFQDLIVPQISYGLISSLGDQYYRLSVPAREYAASKLSDEEEYSARLRHSVYYIRVLKNANKLYAKSGKETQARDMIKRDWAEITSGQSWAADAREGELERSQLCIQFTDNMPPFDQFIWTEIDSMQWFEAGVRAANWLMDGRKELKYMIDLIIINRRAGRLTDAAEIVQKTLSIANSNDYIKQYVRDNLEAYDSSKESFDIIREYLQLVLSNPLMSKDRERGAFFLNLAGFAYEQARLPQEAINHYQQALSIFKDIGDHTREAETTHKIDQLQAAAQKFSLQGLINLSKDALHHAKYQEAQEYLQQTLTLSRAIQDGQVEEDVLSMLGNIFLSQGEPSRAINYYTQAIELAPNNAGYYQQRGLGYQSLMQYEQAIADLTIAIDLDPDSAANWGSRGSIYYNVGQYEAAINDTMRAIELNPVNPGYALLLGTIFHGARQYEQAVAYKTRAIELAGDTNASYYLSRGRSFYEAHQYERAIVDVTKAIELSPKDAENWYIRGSSYQAISKYELAKSDYEQAVVILQETGEHERKAAIAWKLAKLFEEQSEMELAAQWMQTAVDEERALDLPQVAEHTRKLEKVRAALHFNQANNYFANFSPRNFEILVTLRLEKGLTQAEVAQFFGLQGKNAYREIGRWEKGYRPSERHRERFLEYLAIKLGMKDSPEDLFTLWETISKSWGWRQLSEVEKKTIIGHNEAEVVDWEHISLEELLALINSRNPGQSSSAVNAAIEMVDKGKLPIRFLLGANNAPYWLSRKLILEYLVNQDWEDPVNLLYDFRSTSYHVSQGIIREYISKRFRSQELSREQLLQSVEILNELSKASKVTEISHSKDVKLLEEIRAYLAEMPND